MMVQLLDCTMRDGAHVNGGNFGNSNIVELAQGLTRANIDIVELGFLRNVVYNRDISSYPEIELAYEILGNIVNSSEVEYALMARADEYDLNQLTECNGKIKYIRIAFYYDYLDNAMKFAKEIIARGYRVTFNLINTPGSSIKDLRRVVDYANEILPSVLTIVDTFGVMSMEELKQIIDEYDSNLDINVRIGLHVHENFSLAFSMAKGFIDYVQKDRNIIIDGSLMGMGRIPGNLCTELISDYMNETLCKNYDITEMMALIENIITPIKKEIPWGYSPAYFLSAKYRVHRSYSEYMLKEKIPLDRMSHFLKEIDAGHSGKFDKDYMDSIINRNL